MIERFRCICCKCIYELSWEDNEDAFYSGVEDTDEDMTDFDMDYEPEYCPFCGTHISFDGD